MMLMQRWGSCGEVEANWVVWPYLQHLARACSGLGRTLKPCQIFFKWDMVSGGTVHGLQSDWHLARAWVHLNLVNCAWSQVSSCRIFFWKKQDRDELKSSSLPHKKSKKNQQKSELSKVRIFPSNSQDFTYTSKFLRILRILLYPKQLSYKNQS